MLLVEIYFRNIANIVIFTIVFCKFIFQIFKALGKNTVVQLYVPPIAAVDTNLVVIWFLAVGTVVIGAYWSGVVANEQRCLYVKNSPGSYKI